MLHSVVFWHISIDIHPKVSQSQICYDIPMFYIAAIFVEYCYTTDSWMFTVTPGFIQSVFYGPFTIQLPKQRKDFKVSLR